MRATRAHLLIFIPAELTNGPVSLRRWPSLIHADPPMDMYSARYALSSLLFLFAPIPLRALQTCRTVLNNYTADMETPPKQVQSGSTRRAVVEREDRQLHCPRWSSCHSSYLGHLHSARCFHFPFTHLVAMIHHNLQKKPAMSLVSSPNVSCKYFRLLFITYLRYLHALLSSIKFAFLFYNILKIAPHFMRNGIPKRNTFRNNLVHGCRTPKNKWAENIVDACYDI